MSVRHRRLIVLRGTAAETAAAAHDRLGALADDDALWLGPGGGRFGDLGHPRRAMGRSVSAAVVDGHGGLRADTLGQMHGSVRGGGALILRFDAERPADRFHRRLAEALARTPARPVDVRPAPPVAGGTAEQALVVDRLAAALTDPDGPAIALVADRGRGKSAALGLALARLPSQTRVAVTGPHPGAVAEVLRFGGVPFTPLDSLLADGRFDVIVVDEAAQLPVPALQRLVEAHPMARLAFATTVRGYEGTGRGFVLRFLRWLEARAAVEHLRLEAPIRWSAADPVERFVFDALLLDAAPDAVDEPPTAWTPVVLDRDALVADEARLRAVFGLLVHAHYRTTPGDLQRLLDGPDAVVCAMLDPDGRVGAVNLLAREGQLDPATRDGLYRGRARIVGHALPETLAADAGRPAAGALRILRSVRIATHPALRRRGLAARLTRFVHDTFDVDLFGTLFGATPGVIAFRRGLGYRLVRLGVSGGRRTGEPAAVMLRPVSQHAHTLVDDLRGHLARDLPRQLDLMASDAFVSADLRAAIMAHGAAACPLEVSARDRMVGAYAFGPRPLEAVAGALLAFFRAHSRTLEALKPAERAVVEGRIVAGRPWRALAAERGASIRATMRATRRAVRAACLTIDPDFADRW